jgi:hypothetical protein
LLNNQLYVANQNVLINKKKIDQKQKIKSSIMLEPDIPNDLLIG